MSDKTKNMIKLVMTLDKETYILYAIIFGLLSLIFGMKFHYHSLFYTSYILLFTSFDLLGYRYLLNGEHSLTNDIQTPAYRILQNGFMYLFYLILYLLASWKIVVSCMIFQWFGGQDLFYYLIGREKISSVLSWLLWTPFGLIRSLLGYKDISKIAFILQAIIGIVAGISLLILL